MYTSYDDQIYRIIIPISHFKSYLDGMEQHMIDKIMDKAHESDEDEQDESEFEIDDDENEDNNHFQNLMFFTSDTYRYLIEFPYILRTSAFLSIYFFLENQLTILCKQIQSNNQIVVSVNDINGRGIEKAHKYLKKVVQIDFPDQTHEWTFIKHCNQLRNCIVHNGGIVNKENKNLLKAIESIPSVSFKSVSFEQELKFEKEFCFKFLIVIESFWNQLNNEYKKILYPYI